MTDETTQDLLRELISEVRSLREAQTFDVRSLSREEAAEYLHVHKDTLYRLAKEGEIAFHQSTEGAPMSFTRADLDTYRDKIRQCEME